MSQAPVLDIEDVITSFYVRLHVQDQTGVLKDITQILTKHDISVEAMFQREAEGDNPVAIVMMTHKVRERDMNRALDEIAALDTVLEDIMRIRVESLDG
jgi:homoserine dehydrogenase